MTYRAKMEKGQVVFEGGIKPADGVELLVDEVEPDKPDEVVGPPAEKTTLGQRLMKLSGIMPSKGLPRDGSRNLDHYIFGTPKDE